MKILKFMALFLFFILLPVLFFFYKISPPQKNTPEERFVVLLNTSEEKIIKDLKDKGFIKDYKIFNIILTIKGWHNKIQPGAYKISKNQNAYQIAQKLVSGPYQKWVLIPPGKRKEQVALILKNVLNWPESLAKRFIAIAEEGYLYPDTYLVNVDADPKEIYQQMKANFNEKFDSKLQKDLLSQNVRNDTAVKIASLIERESGSKEDKPIIAGIIWNRLIKGMKLEIDATVQYAIATNNLAELERKNLFPNENFDFWPKLGPGIVKKVNSAYNTYLIKGLPPGPICSPSLDSLSAVAYPASTSALYYLHSSDKQIHTAESYEEHQQNILKYLQ